MGSGAGRQKADVRQLMAIDTGFPYKKGQIIRIDDQLFEVERDV